MKKLEDLRVVDPKEKDIIYILRGQTIHKGIIEKI